MMLSLFYGCMCPSAHFHPTLKGSEVRTKFLSINCLVLVPVAQLLSLLATVLHRHTVGSGECHYLAQWEEH